MGRKTRSIRGSLVKRKALILITFLLIGLPDKDAFSAKDRHLPEWLALLEKGDSRERQFALSSLWFLGYQEERKDNKVFDPVLKALVADPDPSVRSAAAGLLMHIGDSSRGCCLETDIVPSLINALEDKNSSVRREAALALGYYKDERAVAPLIKTLQDEDPWVRLNAVFSLGIGVPKAYSITPYVPLGSAEQTLGMDSSGRIWYPTLEYGWEGRRLDIEKVVQPLLDLLAQDLPDWRHKFVQQEVIIALRKIRPANHKRAISVLIQKSGDSYLRGEIIKTLGALSAKEAKEIIEKATQDPDERIRRSAVGSLSRLLSPVYGPQYQIGAPRTGFFIKMIKDPSVEVRKEAVEKLGQTGDAAAVNPLLEALQDGNDGVRQKAIEALEKFEDERILDAMLPFFGSYLFTQSPAEKTFLSVAEKTKERDVYVYRIEGVRYVANRYEDVPKGVSRDVSIVHPEAVGKLLGQFNGSDERAKVDILDVLGRIEDGRIEPFLIRVIEDPSAQVRQRTVSLLGSVGSPAAVPYLINVLRGKDRGMRESAAKALVAFQDQRALEPLIAAINDPQASMRSASLRSLGKFDDPRVLDLNLELLKDESPEVRRIALENVLDKRDQRAVELVVPFLNDQDWFTASLAAKALGEIGDPRGVEPLIKAAKGEFSKNKTLNDDMALRRNAAEGLGKIGDPSALDVLKALLDDKLFYPYRGMVIESIGRIKDKRAVEVLIELLNSPDSGIVTSAIIALGKLHDSRAVNPLIKIVAGNQEYRSPVASNLQGASAVDAVEILISSLTDKDPQIRNGAILLLGNFRSEKAVEPLKKLLEEPDPLIRTNAKDSLSRIEKFVFLEKQKGLGFGARMDLPAKPIVGGGTRSPQRVEIHPQPEQKEEEFDVISTPLKVFDLKPLIAGLKNSDPQARRKAAESLGDSGDKTVVGLLIPALKDKNEYVRQAAARALGKLKDRQAVEPLINTLNDPDINVRAFALWSLGETGDHRAVEPVALHLRSNDDKIRESGFDAMRKFEGPAARKVLINTLIKSRYSWMLNRLISLEGEDVVLKAFEDPGKNHVKTVGNYVALLAAGDPVVSGIAGKALKNEKDRDLVITEILKPIKTGHESRFIYVRFLGDLGDPKGLPILRELLENNEELRKPDVAVIIEAIGKLNGYQEIEETLMEILLMDTSGNNAREHAARALGKVGNKSSLDVLIKIAKDMKEDKYVRMGAVGGLGNFREKEVVQVLINILEDAKNDQWVRIAAIYSLGSIGDESAVSAIKKAASADSTGYIKNAASAALRKIAESR